MERTTNCPECNGLMKSSDTYETLVSCFSPPGHDHDDNCRITEYVCTICGCGWICYTKNKKVEDE